MGLKILHSADWHLDSPFSGFPPKQRAYLKTQHARIPSRIAQVCCRENCDLVLLSGDLFDGPCSPETLDAVTSALAECRVPVFISPGNHDYLGLTGPWNRTGWPENVHIFRGGLESLAVPELDCRIWGAGYRSMDCPALLKDFRAEGRETYHLGILHGDPLVPSSPYCPVTSAQVRASGLTYLALGHIHKSGSFSAGETLCGWPGCPMGRGFDETGEKGVYLVEIGEKTELRFVPLDTPRFYDLEADMDRRAVEELLPGAGSDDFYRVTLTGSVGTPLPQLWEMLSRFPNLELIDRRQAPADPWENLDEDTLEGTYLRLLQRKLEGADPRREELIALAAEISRKILEGKEVIL